MERSASSRDLRVWDEAGIYQGLGTSSRGSREDQGLEEGLSPERQGDPSV